MMGLKRKLNNMELLTDSNILKLERLTQELSEAELKDKNGSVLLVDDEAIITEDYSDTLHEKGYYTESVRNGEDALNRLRARHFTIMITDLRMSGMSGIELIDKAHIIRPDMKIIIATAYPKDYLKGKKLRRKGDFVVKAILTKCIDINKQLIQEIEGSKEEN